MGLVYLGLHMSIHSPLTTMTVPENMIHSCFKYLLKEYDHTSGGLKV